MRCDFLEKKENTTEELELENKDLESQQEETDENAEVTEEKETEEVLSIEEILKEQNAVLKNENSKLANEIETLKERLLRVTAEYENFRKRTQKEKEGIYTDAVTDVIKEVLPVLDNLERALAVEGSAEDIKKGVEMTHRGFNGALEKLGVEEIDASGDFDPNMHQAVMHEQNEDFGPNKVAEVFLKGYRRSDKIIRYSMVKVVN